jgi:hypothetical protein
MRSCLKFGKLHFRRDLMQLISFSSNFDINLTHIKHLQITEADQTDCFNIVYPIAI